jgi:hypothetical protein
MESKEKYRYDNSVGHLYIYDAEIRAYVYVASNPYALSLAKLIAEYEDGLAHGHWTE